MKGQSGQQETKTPKVFYHCCKLLSILAININLLKNVERKKQ